jgi:hypothetical protein
MVLPTCCVVVGDPARDKTVLTPLAYVVFSPTWKPQMDSHVAREVIPVFMMLEAMRPGLPGPSSLSLNLHALGLRRGHTPHALSCSTSLAWLFFFLFFYLCS